MSWEEARNAWGDEDDRCPAEYETQAQLAHDVLYAALRAPLLAIVFEQNAERKDRAPKVISVDEEGAVEYSGRGKARKRY